MNNKAELIAIIKEKQENKPMIRALKTFVKKQFEAKEVDKHWVEQSWAQLSSFPFPELLHEFIPPLWNRLLISSNDHLKSVFLKHFQQFIVKQPAIKAAKLYQQIIDDL